MLPLHYCSALSQTGCHKCLSVVFSDFSLYSTIYCFQVSIFLVHVLSLTVPCSPFGTLNLLTSLPLSLSMSLCAVILVVSQCHLVGVLYPSAKLFESHSSSFIFVIIHFTSHGCLFKRIFIVFQLTVVVGTDSLLVKFDRFSFSFFSFLSKYFAPLPFESSITKNMLNMQCKFVDLCANCSK